MSDLAIAATAVFFFLTLVLGIQLVAINLVMGILALIAWALSLYRLVTFMGAAKSEPECDYPPTREDEPSRK